jgi:hypothetical protein
MLSEAPTGTPAVLALDRRDQLLVLREPLRLEARLLLREVAGVLRVELVVVADNRVDHQLHVRRRVPAVGVAAGLDPDEIADVEDDSSRDGIRCDQLVRPGVVADAVHDHHPRTRDRARVGGGRLVVVRVGRGTRDHAADLNPVAAEL